MGKHRCFRIILIPLLCTVLGCALLFCVSCIPDSLVFENASRSAQQLKNMGPFSVVINEDDPSCTLDSYTDQQIVMEAYTLSRSNPGSVLLNPRHWSDDESQTGSFDALINHSAPLNSNYFRYWMGFRIFVRPLLIFTDYFGMLKLVGAVLTVLGFCIGAAIGRGKDMLTALCFAAAIALVNPAIIAQSLQFCCCFIMALVFMSVILRMRNRHEIIPELFCLFGVATQFFDFYTSPVLCYGFPVLLLICFNPYRERPWRTMISTAASWFYGYVSMWLMKLLCVSVFSNENGFYNGFDSLAGRLGIKIVEEYEQMYDVKGALQAVWWVSCPGENEKFFFLLLAALVVLSAVILILKKGAKTTLSYSAFLAIAFIPVIWFCIAAQPTMIHFWFQYRSIALLFAGVFLFIAQGAVLIKQKN